MNKNSVRILYFHYFYTDGQQALADYKYKIFIFQKWIPNT